MSATRAPWEPKRLSRFNGDPVESKERKVIPVISAEENEMLTRVGSGTAMGELLRRYWVPALLSEEVLDNDCAPVEVQLMGEELVAFRDSDGEVGLLERHCPHRRASLCYGRNEEGGLRCIYHGWKFDVKGRCVDMPTQHGTPFRGKALTRAYPTRDVAGVIWTYMGPADLIPPFPEYHWLQLWPGQSKEFKVLEECNFLQAIEGGLDSAHAGFLHRGPLLSDSIPADTAPKLQVQYTRYGYRYGAIRDLGNHKLVRITPYIFPITTVVPPAWQSEGGQMSDNDFDGARVVNVWVPRDDYTTWHYQYFYNPKGEIDIDARIQEAGLWVDENYRKLRNKDNHYLWERKSPSYSGVEGIVTQDHMANESQGPIVDRTKERLGTTDIAVIAMRRLLLRNAIALQRDGIEPTVGRFHDLPFSNITSQSISIDSNEDWQRVLPLDSQLETAEIS